MSNWALGSGTFVTLNVLLYVKSKIRWVSSVFFKNDFFNLQQNIFILASNALFSFQLPFWPFWLVATISCVYFNSLLTLFSVYFYICTELQFKTSDQTEVDLMEAVLTGTCSCCCRASSICCCCFSSSRAAMFLCSEWAPSSCSLSPLSWLIISSSCSSFSARASGVPVDERHRIRILQVFITYKFKTKFFLIWF